MITQQEEKEARRRIEEEGMKCVNAIRRKRDRSRFDIFPEKKEENEKWNHFQLFPHSFLQVSWSDAESGNGKHYFEYSHPDQSYHR